jgi:hypothetical protein
MLSHDLVERGRVRTVEATSSVTSGLANNGFKAVNGNETKKTGSNSIILIIYLT